MGVIILYTKAWNNLNRVFKEGLSVNNFKSYDTDVE